MPIDLSQHQAGDGMIIDRRVRRPVEDMRWFRRLIGKKPVGPLAGNDKINPLFNQAAVGTQARLMAAGKKRQHTQTGHRRLRLRQRGK